MAVANKVAERAGRFEVKIAESKKRSASKSIDFLDDCNAGKSRSMAGKCIDVVDVHNEDRGVAGDENQNTFPLNNLYLIS